MGQDGPPASARLESWKEVARHMHASLGSIYAFRDELDAWWTTGLAG